MTATNHVLQKATLGRDAALRQLDQAERLRRASKTVVPRDGTDRTNIIATATDITAARLRGRALALQMGFSATESTLVAAAISELARNIVLYAKSGTIQVGTARDGGRVGLRIVARDHGPGFAQVKRALIGGYSTSDGSGLGLSGVRRIMDELAVKSCIGKGTTITAMIWLSR